MNVFIIIYELIIILIYCDQFLLNSAINTIQQFVTLITCFPFPFFAFRSMNLVTLLTHIILIHFCCCKTSINYIEHTHQTNRGN